ncbi:MAG: class I SAM-dependent methyltransferase [Chloroflexota bacterium]
MIGEDADADREARRAVIANELAWHEEEAHRRVSLDSFLYAPPAFDAVVQSSLKYLQPNENEWVLDLGCGEGKEALELVRQGAGVIGVDLSHQQLGRAREHVLRFAPKAKIHFVQANAEELPFCAGAFRSIHGKAIIHHLDLKISADEIKRLLQPKGRATFAEPLAQHPLFWLGRQLTPRLRTKDEHPLAFDELSRFGGYFQQSEVEAYFFLAPLGYVLRRVPGGERPFQLLHHLLQRIDTTLFGLGDKLKGLAWYGMVKVEK